MNLHMDCFGDNRTGKAPNQQIEMNFFDKRSDLLPNLEVYVFLTNVMVE